MGPCRCFTKYLPFIFVALSPNVFAVTEDTVRSVLDETQAILVDGPALLQDYSLMAKIEDFQKEIEELKILKEQLEQREKEIDRLVAKANAKQLEGFIARLNETFVKETALRNLTESIKSAPKTKKTDSEVAFVDRNELQSKFNTMQMISDSDYEISEWVLRVTQKELEEYKQNLISSYETSLTLSSQGCPTATEVVQEVQAALTKFSQDGIGMIDHAQGGEIVHIMTSPTFAPPPTEDHLLGNVWWRKFIPEDWEQLLPSGWESWNVGLPAFVYHSLNLRKGTTTSPPETILENRVQPGSCWPMDGSRGQVTFRLPYAIKLESFSLDHVPWSIMPEGVYTSAPKKLKVIAYPPCLEPNICGALGFDAADPMEVAHIEYDMDGPVVQTFDSIFVQAAKPRAFRADDEAEIDVDEDEGEDEVTSCSQEAAACSSPPEMDVAAITVKILENHGNLDYTCMYRFRVHGEQVLS